jgi:hypothetical protein
MEIIYSLLTHTSLLLILLSSAMGANYLLVHFTQGLMGIHSLSFSAIKNTIVSLDLVLYLFMIALIGTPVFCLAIISWIASEAIYILNDQFNLLDIFSISICFFFCVLSFITSCTLDLVCSNRENGEYYYPFSVSGLNLSFTPTIIITSFITIGMFFTYYHHN